MICDGRYKLVRRWPDGPDEFYDLEKDPGEYSNAIDRKEYSDVIEELDKRLRAWFDRYSNPAFDGRFENVTGKGQITSHIFK